LNTPEGVDLRAYARQVLSRFENQSLKHRTFQVAMDGSQKLPQRILRNARRRLQKGLKMHVMPFSVAAWMRYVSRVDETGQAVRVQDPLAARFAAIAEDVHKSAPGDAKVLAAKLFAVTEVFGEDGFFAAYEEAFVAPVVGHLQRLLDAKDEEQTFVYVTEFVATLPSPTI